MVGNGEKIKGKGKAVPGYSMDLYSQGKDKRRRAIKLYSVVCEAAE